MVMPLGSRNKQKSFTVLVQRAGLDSNSVRCNTQQNIYLSWAIYTNLIWEHLSCKGNLNPAYWFAPLPMQSLCCVCSLSLKDKMVIANLWKRQRFSTEQTEHCHWGSNSAGLPLFGFACNLFCSILFRESFLLSFSCLFGLISRL